MNTQIGTPSDFMFGHIPLDFLLEKGIVIRIKNTKAEILKKGEIILSYPKIYDAPESFFERCESFYPEIKTKLFDIMDILHSKEYFFTGEKYDIEKIEEKLSSESKIFLYTLAMLYSISSIEQKIDILESLQIYALLPYSETHNFILKHL